jgi:hypothetical protein
VELTEEILSRLQQTTPVPSRTALLVALAVGLLLVLIAWRPVRLLTTVCHEAGHALVAVLAGRRLRGVRVHSDTSGLTLSRGRPSGPGMVFTLLAGYPAGSLVGLVGVWLVLGGHGYLFAWLLAAAAAVLLLRIRNLIGALVVIGLTLATGLLAWYGTGVWVSWLLLVGSVTQLLAGPRTVLEAWGRPGSDAAQLAALTRVPRAVWTLLWLALGLGALALAGAWTLPFLL